MFNRPHPSKRAKAWRPEPGLLSHSSSRGFATTRWGVADDDDGFTVDDIKRTKDGFALDEYAQVPLSPQAIQALKRLKTIAPDDPVVMAEEVIEAPEKFQVEAWNANAHLPFVVDAYAYDDEDLPHHTASEANIDDLTSSHTGVAEQTNDAVTETSPVDNQVEVVEVVQETITASVLDAVSSTEEITASMEAMPSVIVEAQATDDTEAQTHELLAESESVEPAVAEVSASDQPEVQASSQALAESPVQEPVDAQTATVADADVIESDLADDEAVAPEQIAAAVEEVVEEVVEDVRLPEPVLAGIDPDLAAQREAEKFAEGLAQGIAQGERQAREAMEQEVQAQCTLLANVTQELQALLNDSKAFYDPLKRLALHLAEQIVKTELKVSTQAIEQLIQSCLDELDHPAKGLVVLELNPEDKARLQAQNPELIRGMRLEAVHDMQAGSVRLFANDAVVEDLVEHRLETLAQSMLRDVRTWKAQSQLNKPDRSAQDMESEDVHP